MRARYFSHLLFPPILKFAAKLQKSLFKRNISLVPALVIICNLWSIANSIQAQSGGKQALDTNSDMLLKRIVISKTNGDTETGFIYGISNDSLLYMKNRSPKAISVNDIEKISVEFINSKREGMLTGGIIGAYQVWVMFLRIINGFKPEEASPAFFLNGDFIALAFMGIAGSVVGAGIGVLAEADEIVVSKSFNFGESTGLNRSEVARFKSFLENPNSASDFHIYLNTAYVSNRFNELAESQKYISPRGVNLFRSANLSYSLFRNIQIGGTVFALGEPIINEFDGEYDLVKETIHKNGNYSEKYSGIGFYGIVSYFPFASNKSIVSGLGFSAGIGSANVSFNSYDYGIIETDTKILKVESQKSIKKVLFSYYLSSHFDLELADGVSLGLVWDYVHIPESREAVPNLNLAAKSLSNMSIGIRSGFHF